MTTVYHEVPESYETKAHYASEMRLDKRFGHIGETCPKCGVWKTEWKKDGTVFCRNCKPEPAEDGR